MNRLKVIFIDEISMVGSGMFKFLNLRLQQIMASKEPFGGIPYETSRSAADHLRLLRLCRLIYRLQSLFSVCCRR